MKAKDWLFRSLVSESWLNALSQKGRLSAIFAMALLVPGGLAGTEIHSSGSLVKYEASFLHKGGSVAIVRDIGGINGQRCASLASRPEVLRSGGFRTELQPLKVANAPGDRFQFIHATHQVLELWTDQPVAVPMEPQAIFLGSAAAAELGAEGGMMVRVGEMGPLRVAGVLDVSVRNPRAARSLIQLESVARAIDECWVEFKPNLVDVGLEILKLQFVHPERAVEVRPWIQLDEFSRDTSTEFKTRPQRLWWIPGGIVLTLLLWLAAWFRRTELAVYRAVGTPPATLFLMGQVDTLLLLVVPSVAGVVLAITVHSGIASELPSMERVLSAARTSFSATALAVILSPLAWLWLGRGDIAPQLKDL